MGAALAIGLIGVNSPTPTPTPTPPELAFIRLEDVDYVLLESGGHIQVEY